MTIEQAFQIVQSACAQVQTSLQGHNSIQKALTMIAEYIAATKQETKG